MLQSMGLQRVRHSLASEQQQMETLRSSLVAQMVKNLPVMQETGVQSLTLEDPLEKGTATRSSILSSAQFSHSVMSDSLQPHGLQHVRLPCLSPISRAFSNSCPLKQ